MDKDADTPHGQIPGISLLRVLGLVEGELHGSQDAASIRVTGISHSSRDVTPGSLFVALPGANHHGAHFTTEAIARGAVAVLTDPEGLSVVQNSVSHNVANTDIAKVTDIAIVVVAQPRNILGILSREVFANPARNMKVIGITGTNGKTTTAFLAYMAALNAGYSVGLIGTLANYINAEEIPSTRTTPEAPDLFALLAKMRDRGVELLVMEVSSIAIEEHRVDGMEFTSVGFTNLSHDHLDYHGDMETYFKAKSKIFTERFSRSGVISLDDEYGRRLYREATIPAVSLGTEPTSQWRLLGAVDDKWHCIAPDGGSFFIETDLPGQINALNALMAIALLDSCGIDRTLAIACMKHCQVPGRGELIAHHRGSDVYVDYAHSPEAIRVFLSGLRDQYTGKIMCIVGAGGDRDSLKRNAMGAAAAEFSDLVIITDDNPRSENPAAIRKQLIAGINSESHAVREIPDRRAAISWALEHCEEGGALAVLGKGHERGQEINHVMYPFHDPSVIRELLLAQEDRNV